MDRGGVVKHIGFTGTRKGMTPEQYQTVGKIVDGQIEYIKNPYSPKGTLYVSLKYRIQCHHGDCVGADENFHAIVRSYGLEVVGHPSTHKLRAHCKFDEERPRKAPLDRNLDIVAESDVMIACPAEYTERITGGTWRTVRMTRQACKPLAIVWPDGTVKYERWA